MRPKFVAATACFWCMACLAMAALGSARVQADPGLSAIWAVDDGEKIFRDDLDNPLELGGGDNTVWDGSTVRLLAARNEIVAFHLILEADALGASAVNVSVSDLTNGDASIRGSHPLLAPNDYLGLGVELFTEHYFDISTPSWDSDCGGLGWSGQAKPGITGIIPDALVPFAAKQGKGGAPFDIGASLNQGVWVDIYVPRTAPAGDYAATITVTVGGEAEAEIPLELEVLNFTLPDETHYKTMVFYSKDTLVERHTTGSCTPEMWEMMLAYNRMAHRHRLELIGCGNFDEANNLSGTLTGEAFTAAGNYDGPGAGVGNSLFSIATYGGWWSQDQTYYETQSDAWVNWFNDNDLGDLEYFLYLTDEPGPSLYPLVRERAAWIHDNPGPGHDLPIFLTRWPISDLVGAIDIWCTPPQFYGLADAAAAQARGERVWLYASYRPNTPADATDEYGIAWRLKAWVAHARNIPRWFTWESTHYYNNSNEVDPGGRKNVWVNPIGFSRDMGDGTPCPMDTGNGDGILFYPGQDAVFPEEDREYAGPVSSIRMKMYRRGIQDVEYMWLAEQLGLGSDVGTMLDGLLPHVMWDALTAPDWSNSNAVYEQARRQLADLIVGGARFPDVEVGYWAYWDIDACAEAGIVGGYADGTYHPTESVSRDQMAVFIARSICTPTGEAGLEDYTPPTTPSFSDVATDYWAYKHIEYAVEYNVVGGYNDGTYHPEYTLDRGQMAVFIARAMAGDDESVPTPTGDPTFPDVLEDFWSYRHIEYIAAEQVAGGYGDGLYHPEDPVSRDQMAVFISRAFDLL